MDYLIWLLALANAFQLVFWSYQMHRLVDKVMSGSYYSYQQAKTMGQKDGEIPKLVDPGAFEDLSGVKSIHPYM